jgi:hypothetical protein
VSRMMVATDAQNKMIHQVLIKAGISELWVKADIVGPFAIHRSISRSPHLNWTITHRRSGLAVRRFAYRGEAIKMAEALTELGDWDVPASRLSKALKEQAGRLMNRLAPLSQ